MSDMGNREIMAKNILYYMDKHHKTRLDVCHDLGFRYTTFCDWIHAKTYPRIDKIELMANYFGVDKSDLVESKQSTPDLSNYIIIDDVNGIKQKVSIDDLDEGKRQELLKFLDWLKNRDNK